MITAFALFVNIGEELPFEPRLITIHTDYWFDRDYELRDEVLGRSVK